MSEIERTVDELCEAVRNDGVLVLRADTSERTLSKVVLRGDAEEEIRGSGSFPFGGLTGRALDRRTPMLVNDAHLDPRAIVYSDPDVPEAMIIYPLLRGGEVVGSLNVYRDGAGVQFADADVELVRPFAERLTELL